MSGGQHPRAIVGQSRIVTPLIETPLDPKPLVRLLPVWNMVCTGSTCNGLLSYMTLFYLLGASGSVTPHAAFLCAIIFRAATPFLRPLTFLAASFRPAIGPYLFFPIGHLRQRPHLGPCHLSRCVCHTHLWQAL